MAPVSVKRSSTGVVSSQHGSANGASRQVQDPLAAYLRGELMDHDSPQSSSHRRTLPIKRADAEPLSREDIQYDLLANIFSNQQSVFTDQSLEGASSRVPRKVTFCELYTCTLIASPRCSKVLREKMSETPEFAIDFAKIALLANVGRINTTMAFFPEMRTVLRSYHPIPSLQKTDANLQDAPRIKNCLKACLLPGELSSPPSTPADIFAKGQAGIVPTTSIVNLIFVLSNHSVPVSKTHFQPPFDFLDLFLPVNASSVSRARAFLWLMFHYLEPPSMHNPFSDDYAEQHPGKIPMLEMLTAQQRLQENVDTPEELEYGRRMAQYRSKFLQKQIADEEKDKNGFAGDGMVKANFKITTPSAPLRQGSGLANMQLHNEAEYHMSHEVSQLHHSYFGPVASRERRFKGTFLRSERTMLEHAWFTALNTDPLVNSDDEAGDEHVKADYERRVHILNAKVRGKDPTPEPGPRGSEWLRNREGGFGMDF